VYDAEIKALVVLKTKYVELKVDQLTVDAWYAEQKRKLDVEAMKAGGILDVSGMGLMTKTLGTMGEGMKAAASNMKNEIQTVGEVAYDVAYTMRDAMADAFTGMITEARNWKEAMLGFAKSVLNAIMQIVAKRVATEIMVGAGFLKMGEMHRGGVVGSVSSPQRLIPISTTIASLPRLHEGLAPDEFPVVLQRGETVIPKNRRTEGVNLVPPTVVINNNTGTPMRQNQSPHFDANARQWMIDVVVDNYQRGGAMRNLIEGRQA